MTIDFLIRDEDGNSVNGSVTLQMAEATTSFGLKRRLAAGVRYDLQFVTQDDIVQAIRGVLPSLGPDDVVAQMRQPLLRMADAVAAVPGVNHHA